MKARIASVGGSLAFHGALIGCVVGVFILLGGPDTEPDAAVQSTDIAGVPDLDIQTLRTKPMPDFNPPELADVEMEIEIDLPIEDFLLKDIPTEIPEPDPLLTPPSRYPPEDRPLKPTPDRRAPSPAVESPPSQVKNPPPDYPRRARRRGQQGSVLIEFDILEDGRISNPRIAESSGIPSLDEAALRAIRAWKFLPATRGGRPVKATQKIRFTFKLQD